MDLLLISNSTTLGEAFFNGRGCQMMRRRMMGGIGHGPQGSF